MKKILIAIPNTGTINTRLIIFLDNLKANYQGKYSIKTYYPIRFPIAHNRNVIVDTFLQGDCDYLLMIDSDIVPPKNILDLVECHKDIISALCFTFQEHKKLLIPLVFRKIEKPEGVSFEVMDFKGREGLVECDSVGTGCILLSRKVLEEPQLKAPFMDYWDKKGIKIISEDMSFCVRAKRLGYKVYTHLNYKCSHFKEMDLKDIYKKLTKKIEPISLE